MAGYHIGNKFKMICGGNKIKKGICGGNVVYSGASPVTYYVDTDTVYTEEVDSGMSCLEPKSFTPSKSGYTFIGWKEDETANDAVLTEKVMTDNEVTLYAVFQKTITLTLYNGSGTATYETGYRYYNNGAITNPTFTVAQTAINGWTARGWSTATTGDASATYSSISNTTFSADVTLYGLYYQVITLKYVVSGATTSKTGNRYYNSKGVYVNPKFTITNPTKSGWTFMGWSTSSTSTTASYSTISNTAFSANATLYSIFKVPDSAVTPADISVDFNNNLSRASTTYIDGTKYSTIQIVATVIAKEQYDQYNATCGIAVNGVKYDLGRIPWDSKSISVNRSFSLANSNSQQISLYISSATCQIAKVGCVFSSCKLTGRTVVG